jgi:tetratricopeptide (TPR) repeat protein
MVAVKGVGQHGVEPSGVRRTDFVEPRVALVLHAGLVFLGCEWLHGALRHDAPGHPQRIGCHLAVGIARARVKRAAEFIGQALALEPDQPVYLCNLGLVLREQGQLGRAIESYERAIALRPGYALAHSNRGAALQEQGQLDEAMVSYAKLVLPSLQEIEGVLNQAPENTTVPQPAQNWVKAISEERKALVFRGLSWLIKMGILKISS